MPFHDYLYIDKNRLDSFYSQIPKKHALTLEVGLETGMDSGAAPSIKPSVKVSQDKAATQISEHEKIVKLLDYAKKGKFLSEGVIVKGVHERQFLYLTDARVSKVVIPPGQELSNMFPGLVMWVSTSFRYVLFLLESSTHDEKEPEHRGFTPFSRWDVFIRSFGIEDPDALKERGIDWRDIEEKYGSEPLKFLAAFGAQVGPERKVNVLYLAREMLAEQYNEWVFGYPIYIRAL